MGQEALLEEGLLLVDLCHLLAEEVELSILLNPGCEGLLGNLFDKFLRGSQGAEDPGVELLSEGLPQNLLAVVDVQKKTDLCDPLGQIPHLPQLEADLG